MSNVKEKLVKLNELKSINLDFEKMSFQINGIDIGDCTDVSIIFHDRKWNVNIAQHGCFTFQGRLINK